MKMSLALLHRAAIADNMLRVSTGDLPELDRRDCVGAREASALFVLLGAIVAIPLVLALTSHTRLGAQMTLVLLVIVWGIAGVALAPGARSSR